jgi:hypothetical protein
LLLHTRAGEDMYSTISLKKTLDNPLLLQE